jgi:hypothetical protein
MTNMTPIENANASMNVAPVGDEYPMNEAPMDEAPMEGGARRGAFAHTRRAQKRKSRLTTHRRR